MYTIGNLNIEEHNYRIYLRKHKIDDSDIYSDVKTLKALLLLLPSHGSMENPLGQAEIEALGNDLLNHIVYVTGSLTALDLSSITAMSEGDTITFVSTSAVNTATLIRLSDASLYTLVGHSLIVQRYTDIDTWEIVNEQSSAFLQNREYFEIGYCEEKPKIETSENSSINTNYATSIKTSDKVDISFADLNTTMGNIGALKDCVSEDPVDILFITEDVKDGIMFKNLQLDMLLDVNGMVKSNFTASTRAKRFTDLLKIIEN